MRRAAGVVCIVFSVVGCRDILDLRDGTLVHTTGGGTTDMGGAGGVVGGAGGVAGGGGETSVPVFAPASIISALEDPQVNIDDPTVTPDKLTLFYNRTGEIYYSQRTLPSDDWSSGLAVSSLAPGPATDTNPRLSPDGNTIWFGRTPVAGDSMVHGAHRSADLPDAWDPPTLVTGFDLPAFETHVGSVTVNDLRIVLERRQGVGLYHLYESTRASTAGFWSPPEPIDELVGSMGNERQPWISLDGLRIYFESDATGDGDIYYATRETVEAPFSTPVPVVSLNTTWSESDPWLTPDETYIVFSRREATGMNAALYQANLQ